MICRPRGVKNVGNDAELCSEARLTSASEANMKCHTTLLALASSRKPVGNLMLLTVLAYCTWGAQSTTANPNPRERLESSQALSALQNPSGTPEVLRLSEPLGRRIKGGETQSFAISINAGQYAAIAIEQHGSILLATLFDQQGAEIMQMDFPAGGYGPIYLSTIASLSGNYRLEIRSVNKWANESNYEVGVTALRSAEAADKAGVDAQLLVAQGRKSVAANKPAAAVEPYNQALVYWRASQDHHWQAATGYALSQAHRSLGNRSKTEESLNETLRILNLQMAPNDWRLKASALNDLGPIYTAVGRQEKAFAVLNEALDLYAANQDRRGQASALNNLAATHSRAGDPALAKELVEKALAFRRAENDKPGVINLLNSLGGISDRLGEPEQALDYLAQALRGWENLDEITPGDRPRIAATLSNLATTSDKLGKWDQARDYYDRALASYDEGDPNRAITLDNKGELYASLGNPEKAKECYDEALTLLATSTKPDVDVKAGILVHIGQLSVAQGDFATAVRIFEEARVGQPSPAKLADVLTNLGASLASQGNLDKAMEAYQSALEIQLKLRDQRGQALTLQKRGEAYALLGKRADALEDLKRALAFWKTIKDRRGEGATLEDIARVEQESGNLAVALANSEEAIGIVESLRTNISSRRLRTSYFATQENYYELDIDLKMQRSKLGNRAEYLASALSSNEKAKARVLLDTLSEAGVDRIEFSQGSDPGLASLIEQRLSLIAKLSAKAQARTTLLTGQHTPAQVVSIDKQITVLTEQYDELEAQLRSRSPRFAALTKPEPATLSEIQQQLDAETLLLEYALGEKYSYVWAVTRDSIDGIELPGRDQIEAIARRVTNSITARNREEKNQSIQQAQLRFERAEKDYTEAALALSKMVLEPVSSLLGQKRLVIVADGALQLVPFAALPVPASFEPSLSSHNPLGGPETLITRNEIVTLPSASVLALQRRELENRKPAPLAVAVIADPVFDLDDVRVAQATRNSNQHSRTLAKTGQAGAVPPPTGSSAPVIHNESGPATRPPLASQPTASSQAASGSSNGPTALASALRDVGLDPNGKMPRLVRSRQEATAIMRAASPDQSFGALDFKASRKTAMSAELSKYRIIHFATHGVLDLDHPELSGIVLSMVDEEGQPQDGYLRLHEIYNLNLPAELVVLSACQTGIGKQIKGEGLIALTRGFMYAGAKSVVASLWKVDDTATSALMADFYNQMFTNKLKPAAALRAAQINLKKQKRWQSPYYWAGFYLQGEWK